MNSNLGEIIKDNKILTESDVKRYMFMILKGLEYLHINWYLHR